jgi:phenylacetate-CoA ligase
MTQLLQSRETRAPAERERDLLARLPALIDAALRAPGWRAHLGPVDARSITSRAALAQLPVLRKSDLVRLQREAPPFGGFAAEPLAHFGRLFSSPGPIYEPEGRGEDPWRAARGLAAAGFGPGEIVLNTFSYHLVPGGFILDSGARALGCAVIPAGPGNTEQQLELITQLRPTAYTGTPDFLKILLDAAHAAGRDASSIRKAAVSGAAFPASLQAEIKARSVDAYQLYATADLGVIAYESAARQGMVVSEDVLLEIVGPDGMPVPEGEVGEVVVTSFDPAHPWLRLALGDLSAVLPGVSPCGRTNTRIKGWLGRADQTSKVKGMFVRPEQVAEVVKRHPQIVKARLLVSRRGETDTMTLKVETTAATIDVSAAVAETLRGITKLSGTVELVPAGSLPSDGKLIEDTRGN